MKHVAYFGDGERTFALTTPMIRELEDKAGVGIGALYRRLMSGQFYLGELVEVIRLGLIGADTAPVEAQRLIDAYAVDRPIMEIVPLALDIIEARWSGQAVTEYAKNGQFAQTDTAGISTEIRAAYADVADV